MPNLVIIESPYKAPAIKNYLGSKYKVVWSTGHVRDLPKSSLGVDIEHDFDPHYINIRGKGDLIKELKKEAKKADKIFLATDPDREGEAIAWHLATALGIPEDKALRITFNENTKTAIKAAVKAPRKIDMDLVNSQQTRRILDRIVGYKLSPFLWKTVKSGLSAGRVQSVATRIIVEREQEIRAFVPSEFWTISASVISAGGAPFNAKFYGDANGKIELSSEADTMQIVNAIEGRPFDVLSVKKTVRHRNPSPPFTTSTMQQDASRKLGFQSQRIMRVAQELYEGINVGSEFGGVQGLITYMRTDSLRVSKEAVDAAKEFICSKYGDKYYPETPRVYKTKENAQDAHEAIRPSNFALTPEKVKKSLTNDQYKLYKLIWDRFLASQMASAALDVESIELGCEGYRFKTSGYTVAFAGFLALYEDSEEANPKNSDEDAPEKTKLPEIAEGESLSSDRIAPQQHFTEPPPRFTEGSLIKFLEEKGIGRPSTYTPTITTIVSRGYVTREAKTLRPTNLGEITTEIMCSHFPNIVDYKFTAEMEDDLDEIENGKNDMLTVLREFYGDFAKELEAAAESMPEGKLEIKDEETDIICDKCGARMVIKNGRFGKFAACPNYPQCKNTMPVDRDGNVTTPAEVKPAPSGMKCELCGADMVIRQGRYGSFYACSKYPECKYTKQIAAELDVPCPECGSKLLIKHGKNRTTFYSCERYPECSFSSWDMPTAELCPKCGKMLFKKKGKNLLVCADKECGYKRETEDEK